MVQTEYLREQYRKTGGTQQFDQIDRNSQTHHPENCENKDALRRDPLDPFT